MFVSWKLAMSFNTRNNFGETESKYLPTDALVRDALYFFKNTFFPVVEKCETNPVNVRSCELPLIPVYLPVKKPPASPRAATNSKLWLLAHGITESFNSLSTKLKLSSTIDTGT